MLGPGDHGGHGHRIPFDKELYTCLSPQYNFGSPMHFGNVAFENPQQGTDRDKAVHYLQQVQITAAAQGYLRTILLHGFKCSVDLSLACSSRSAHCRSR